MKKVDFDVAVFCDSDKDNELNPNKKNLREKNIKIIDCELGNSIEQQVFKDLPWGAMSELINYVMAAHEKDEEAIIDSVKSKHEGSFPANWLESDTASMRKAIGICAKGNQWFKRIDHGEKLGDIIFKYWNEIDDSCRIKNIFTELSDWIDK